MIPTLQIEEHLSPEQISAYVDREPSANERSAVEQHLGVCHECALRVLDAMRMKAATASAAKSVSVPADALARLTTSLQEKQPARIYSLPAAKWMALAACLLLAISLIGWQQLRRSDTLSAELLDQHLAVLSSGAAPDVISTDRHTVKPWFQGKLPFSFNLPETLPPNTTLQGGDLVYVDGHPAAMLLFTVGKHQASVFLTQRTGRVASLEQSETRSGFQVHYATTRELNIAAVSDVNAVELNHLVTSMTQAQ